jgi:thioredoxin reductase
VPGVWGVGHAAAATEQLINATSAGYRAAQAINASLMLEDLDSASN